MSIAIPDTMIGRNGDFVNKKKEYKLKKRTNQQIEL